MVKNILKSDIYKVLRDRQTIGIIILYVILVMTNWPSNVWSLKASEVLELTTRDFGFIMLLVSLSASSAFALDYSNDTLKDILPYYSRKAVFLSKWGITILTALATQLFCYLLGIIACVAITSSFPSSSVLGLYIGRFIIHFSINITNIGFILFLSNFFKHRAIINALMLISILIVRFFPIGKGRFLFEYLDPRYEWGASIDFIFLIGSSLIALAFIMLSYQLFKKREV